MGHHQAARPGEWTSCHLYVILDIFSRYIVGWMVATRESAALAEKLIAATCDKQGIIRGQLSIHADRGSSMTSGSAAVNTALRVAKWGALVLYFHPPGMLTGLLVGR